VSRSRWLALLVVVLALVFAVEGGTYTTLDWLRLRSQERRERENVVLLKQQVDSLQRVLKAVTNDPREQERRAREQFGMIARGEILYRLVPAEP
jgi:cell division protein FtsB